VCDALGEHAVYRAWQSEERGRSRVAEYDGHDYSTPSETSAHSRGPSMITSDHCFLVVFQATHQARKSNQPRATCRPPSRAPFGVLLTSWPMTRRQHSTSPKYLLGGTRGARYRVIVLSLAILSHPDPDEAHLHPSSPWQPIVPLCLRHVTERWDDLLARLTRL
jgi:hypothetical protein